MINSKKIAPNREPTMCRSNDATAANAAPLLEKNEKKNLKRMRAVQRKKGNNVCADCPAKNPLWLSFLKDDKEDVAVLCCETCARHHHYELGTKRCKIKYSKMTHELTTQNVDTLEKSGNKVVNKKYEATLTKSAFEKDIVLQNEDEEASRRGKFIKHKYKKKKYCRNEEKVEVVTFQRQVSGQSKAGEKQEQKTLETPKEKEENKPESPDVSASQPTEAEGKVKEDSKPTTTGKESARAVCARARESVSKARRTYLSSSGASAGPDLSRRNTTQPPSSSGKPPVGPELSRRHTTQPPSRVRRGGPRRAGDSGEESSMASSVRASGTRRQPASARAPRRTRSKSVGHSASSESFSALLSEEGSIMSSPTRASRPRRQPRCNRTPKRTRSKSMTHVGSSESFSTLGSSMAASVRTSGTRRQPASSRAPRRTRSKSVGHQASSTSVTSSMASSVASSLTSSTTSGTVATKHSHAASAMSRSRRRSPNRSPRRTRSKSMTHAGSSMMQSKSAESFSTMLSEDTSIMSCGVQTLNSKRRGGPNRAPRRTRSKSLGHKQSPDRRKERRSLSPHAGTGRTNRQHAKQTIGGSEGRSISPGKESKVPPTVQGMSLGEKLGALPKMDKPAKEARGISMTVCT